MEHVPWLTVVTFAPLAGAVPLAFFPPRAVRLHRWWGLGVTVATFGLALGMFTRFSSNNAGFQLGLIAFTAAVLGGIGNLAGAVLGGVLIGVIQGLNDGLPYAFGQEWSQSVVFAILIMLMVFKPTGLLGQNIGEKV